MSGWITHKTRAIILIGIIIVSGMGAGLGAATLTPNERTQSLNGTVSASQESADPSVSILTESINDSTQTTLRIAYDPGQQNISDLKLNLHGPQTNATKDQSWGLYEAATADSAGQFNSTLNQSGGTLSIAFPSETFGGGPIPLKAELVNETGEYTQLGSEKQTYDIASTVSLSSWSISPTTTAPGEDITVTATLTNNGDTNDSYTLIANASHSVLNSTYVTLESGTTRTVTLTFTNDYPTTEDVWISGRGPTTVSFESQLQVEARSVSTTSALVGENVTLSAVVNNTGTSESTRTVYFDFGGTRMSRQITVAGGGQQAVSVNVSAASPGRYYPSIAGEYVDTVTINSQLDITAVQLNQSTIDIGSSVLVTTALDNPTTNWVNETIDISVSGDSVTRQVAVPPGENTTISGALQPTRAGKQTITVAGTRTETFVQVDGVLEIVDGSVSINRSTVAVGEQLAVNFTYRNPSNSGYTPDREIFISVAGGFEEVPVSLSPGETQDVTVSLTPTRARSEADVQAGSKNLGTVTVESPVLIEQVDYDYKVIAGETATVTYVLNNTDKTTSHSRTVDVWGNTNDGDSVDAQKTVELSAGETRNVTLSLDMVAPGDYHLSLANGQEGGIAVLNDTFGEANLTTIIQDTETVSVRNEARFFANVTNYGTADGAELITLQRTQDGPVIEADAVLAKPGESEFASVAMEFDSPGNKTVYVNGEAVNLTVTEPYVLDTNISVVNGTVPDRMPVPEGGYDRGYLNIEFRINDRRASSYDLSRIGADKSTRFKVEMTVRDFNPDTVVATGQDIEWNATSLADNKTRITLYVNPVDQSYLQDVPDFGEWGDKQRTAAFTIQNMVQYRVYGNSPDNTRSYNWANGLAISTNAQRYSAPRYYETENGSRFEVKLAAAHFREDGSLNTGHYTAQIPDAMLNEWGVDSPSDLEAAYTGADDTTIEIMETADGMEVSIDLHYSSGTVSVGEQDAIQSVVSDGQQDTSNPDDSSDSGSDTSPDSNTSPDSDTSPDTGSQPSPSGDSNSPQESADSTGSATNQTTTAPTTTPTTDDEVTNDTTTPETTRTSTTPTSVPETTSPPSTTIDGTVTTGNGTTTTLTGADTTGGATPGFGPLTTLFVLGISAILLGYRSRSQE